MYTFTEELVLLMYTFAKAHRTLQLLSVHFKVYNHISIIKERQGEVTKGREEKRGGGGEGEGKGEFLREA